jgi:hypothetical protein
MRLFRLGEVIEDIIDLLVGLNVVWPFEPPVEGGNRPESYGDSLLVNDLCFDWIQKPLKSIQKRY